MTASLSTIRVHGLGLTDDFLLQLSDRAQTTTVPDATPKSYDLPPKTTLEEAVLDAWDDARKAWAKYQSHGQDAWNAWVRPLLRALDYQFGGQGAVGGKYTVNQLAESGDVPLHFTAAPDLDRVTEETGLRVSPHGRMQGYLNATPEHLWGVVTNGDVLRVLRDNNQVTRPAYVEFRLADIMNGEDARAFRVMWLLLHRTRLRGAKGSLLEKWNAEAGAAGVKARDSLRDGVARAIEAIGTGLLHRNPELGEQLAKGDLQPAELYRACLKLIYQMVFLFVVEDRDLLFARDDAGNYVPSAQTRERARHYLTRALRDRAVGQEGSVQHTDAYDGWNRLLGYLRTGFAPLGLPALGSDLFRPHLLNTLKLSNRDFFAALRAMSEIEVDRTRRPVNYAGLDSEELGSIYESLLELVPVVQAGPALKLVTLAGNERKTTGSYYTPTSLIELLLESALDPVIAEAVEGKPREEAAEALKGLKIIDPACGSGHFLIAAARRVGGKLAELQENTAQPSPDAQRRATRAVIAHCIYGTDINPMAIELAKVALWLESQDAGKPLAFLDHRLRVGNALLGATPGLLRREDEIPEKKVGGVIYPPVRAETLHVPDGAFSVIEGDDKTTVAALKKRNKIEREQAIKANKGAQMFDFALEGNLRSVTRMMQALDKIEPENIENVQAQESTWHAIQQQGELQRLRTLSDAWCAAFVLPKVAGSPVVTTSTLHQLNANPQALPEVQATVGEVARQYRFLHTYIEFPDVQEKGGFDCVLGNPPWERLKLQEKEWFAQRVPEIAAAANAAARTRMIKALKIEQPSIYAAFQRDLRQAEGESHFIRSSGRYPLTGRGDVNTYAIFSEANRDSLNPQGRMGIIVPVGVLTDDSTKDFFQDTMNRNSLASAISFYEIRKFFVGTDSSTAFTLLTLASRVDNPTFVFGAKTYEDVYSKDKRFVLTAKDIALLNPNTRTAPVFRTARDASITKGIYYRIPVLVNEETGHNPWNISFMAMFHMSGDSSLFRTASELKSEGWAPKGNHYVRGSDEMLPLYEGKLIQQFDHRFATYSKDGTTSEFSGDMKLQDEVIMPRYWVDSREVKGKLSRHSNYKQSKWLLGFRKTTKPGNMRTLISSVIPIAAVGDKMPLYFAGSPSALIASFNSFVLDYVLRQKMGGVDLTLHYKYQLPVLPPSSFTSTYLAFITPRVLELTYTTHDLAGFAQDLGYEGEPFRWDDHRRFWLRAELDALFFHLYGIGRDDVDYIMDTFPIVRRKDEAAHGTYRTKEAILQVYDQLGQLGLDNLGHYVPAWDVQTQPPLSAEAEADPVFKAAILNTFETFPYIAKPFHQTRVAQQRPFKARKTVKDWEDAIADSAP